MNKDHDYAGVTDNQLHTLEHIGLFSNSVPDDKQKLGRLADPYDPHQDLDARARSYLHVNCHHCHVHEGGGNARINLEFRDSISGARVLNEKPQHDKFGLDDARLIAAGHPERSVLFFRQAKLGRGRMPYAGPRQVDVHALDLLHEWISQLTVPTEDKADEQKKEESAESSNRDSDVKASGKSTDKSQNASAEDTEAEKEHVDAAIFDAKSESYLKAAQTLISLSKAEMPNAPRRVEIIDSLLSSTSSAVVLSRVVDELDAKTRSQVVTIATGHASEPVRDLFERYLPEQQRTERLGDQFETQLILNLPGNVSRGKQLFFEAQGLQCKSCHRVDAQPDHLGPNLGAIGKKYNRAQLLESIILPSKTIEPKYATYSVQTEDGKVYTGLLVQQDESDVVLRNAEGKEIKLVTEEVEQIAPQSTSMMPKFLFRDLTARQAADLLAYLGSLKSATSEAQ